MPGNEPVQGLQDLLDSMEGLTLSQMKNVIARALRRAGRIIMEAAQRFAPNDPRTPGSSIADSMSVIVREQTATGAIAEIGPSKRGFAGIFAETGTARQQSRPWLSRAFEETGEHAYETLANEFGDEIEREFYKRR